MADVSHAVADSVEHLEGGHHFTRRVHCYFEFASGKRTNTLGDALGRHAGPRQTFRP